MNIAVGIAASAVALAIVLGGIFGRSNDKEESSESPDLSQVALETQQATAEASESGSSPQQLSAAGISANEQLGVLYRELQIFKKDRGFHANGFSESGQSRWMTELRELETTPNQSFSAKLALKSLIQLGHEYRSNGGANTELARFLEEKIVTHLGLDAGVAR